MAYVKSKKMRLKKKARKSRKMKRIRGGSTPGEGDEPVPTNVTGTTETTETTETPASNATRTNAAETPASNATRTNAAETAAAAPRPTLQDLIGELNNFMPKLSSELATDLRGIIAKFQ